MLRSYLPQPTEETWRQIAQVFKEKWDLGLVAGKNNMITKHSNLGCCFSNYKATFSIVLLASWMPTTTSQLFKLGILGETETAEFMPTLYLGVKIMQVTQDACLPGGEELGEMPYTMVGCCHPTKALHETICQAQHQLHERHIQLSSLSS